MSTDLRRITAGDWEAFRDLRLRALADSPTAFGVTLAEAQQHDEAFWRARAGGPSPTYLLLDDGTPVAMGGIFVGDDPTTAYVWGMWTSPEARGRGHAETIVRALVAWAGDREIVLHVTEGNTSARDLYTRLGFVPTGTWEPLREGSDLRIEELRRLGPG